MTYRDLLETLQMLTDDELNKTVMVYNEISDDYFPVRDAYLSKGAEAVTDGTLLIDLE